MFDKFKEDAREMLTGANPDNDLRARLHADHNEIDRLIDELKSTEAHEYDLRVDILNQLAIALTAHERAEEMVVYRMIQDDPRLRDKIDHAFREHREIDQALDLLDLIKPSDPSFLEKVNALQQCVEQHVHDEEGDLLPKAESVIGRDYLARVIPAFNERKRELAEKIREERRGRELASAITETDFGSGPTPFGLDEVSSQW